MVLVNARLEAPACCREAPRVRAGLGLWQGLGSKHRRGHSSGDQGKAHVLKRPAVEQQFKIEIPVLKKDEKGREAARIGGCSASCQCVFVKRLLTDSSVVRGRA